jgi:hypothetical protein
VLDGAVGATGLVEGVERGHVLGGQREVEDASVLDDALAVGGLRQDDQVALQAPAQEDLRRRAPDALGDLADAPVAEMAAGAQRAVGLERDAALLARLEQAPAELERAELDLVDDRWRLDVREQLVELGKAEVRDADRARVPSPATPTSGRRRASG